MPFEREFDGRQRQSALAAVMLLQLILCGTSRTKHLQLLHSTFYYGVRLTEVHLFRARAKSAQS
jgi:hypothetical protein